MFCIMTVLENMNTVVRPIIIVAILQSSLKEASPSKQLPHLLIQAVDTILATMMLLSFQQDLRNFNFPTTAKRCQ